MTLAEMRKKVSAQLMGVATEERSLVGEARPTEKGWQIRFVVFEEGTRLGERVLELEGLACRQHDDAILLVAGLLLEHGPPEPLPDLEPPPEPPPDPAAEDAPPPHEELPPERSDKIARGESPYLLWRASAGLALLSGWMPRPSFGPSLGLGLRLSPIAFVEVQGSYFPTQRKVDADSTGKVVLSAAQAVVRGCADLPYKNFSVLGCFGLGYIGLYARGEGIENPQNAAHHSPEASATLGGAWHASDRVALTVAGDLRAPFRRGRFGFASGEELVQVHETNRILFGAQAGIAVQF
jgi:hypothetical protein